MMCRFDSKPLQEGGKYIIRHTSSEARAMVKDVVYKMDINQLSRIKDDKKISMNEIFRVKLRTTKPLFFDSYKKNRTTGSIVLIDEATNNTVAAGMLRS